MRAAWIIGVLALATVTAGAQIRGRAPQPVAPPRPAFPFDASLPPVSPIPFLGPQTLPGAASVAFGQPVYPRRFYPRYGYPYGVPLYSAGYVYGGAPSTNVFIIQNPPPPEPPPLPPEPAKPEVRDYKWPDVGKPEVTAEEMAAFAIALRSGVIESASAVWIQEGKLHYVTPEGVRHELRPEAIDRELTDKLNRERGLRLPNLRSL